MSNYEIAMVIVTVALILISILYIVSMLINNGKLGELEMKIFIIKGKYFDLDENIFDLEKRIEKLEPKDEANTPPEDDHWGQAREYTLNAIRNNPINDEVLKRVLGSTDEEWKIKNPYAQVSSRMSYKTWMTIKECIDLLSTDGKGTKQQVKEKLEELIKDE